MDFALVASDLSSTAIPIPQTLAEEPNADWILSWLEASPVVQSPVNFEAVPRLATIAMAVPSTQVYDLAFEVVAPPPAEREDEAEAPVAVAAEELVVELLSEELPEFEPVEDESDEASASVTPPASIVTTTWTVSTAPSLDEGGPPIERRVPDAPRLRPVTDSKERQAVQTPADKGEIIWEADFIVAAPEATRAAHAPPIDLDPRPESAAAPEVQAASARRQPDSQDPPTHQEQEPEDSRGASGPEVKRKQAAQPASKQEGVEASEPEPRVAKRIESVEKRESPITIPPPKQASHEAPAEAKIERAKGPAAVEEVAPAQRIRPGQIARVQVDIGAAGQAPGGDPAMRLVLTQRGENVSVHVRSWNDTAVPLTAREVHPLLENLAKQGLSPASESVVESAPIVDAPKERTMALGQPAASDPDTRGFNGFDERQQRQQEQHRQQQEVLTRRQQRATAEFDLKSVLDEIQTR